MDNEDAIAYYDGDDYDDDKDDRPENRPPKIPLGRRGWAFGIDFAAAWLLSSLVGGNSIVFLLAWLGLRVILPIRNYGQSVGRYALDIKLIDDRFHKTPGFVELVKREGITGFGAMLATIAIA
ncbi:MAG: RDD family protein, partial [Geitlerinemataceae cyanobacterium]